MLKVNVPKEVRGTFGTWICSGRVANSFDEAGIPLPIPRIIHTKYGNLVKFKIAIDDQYRKGRAIILDVKADGDMAEKVCRMKLHLGSHITIQGRIKVEDVFEAGGADACLRIKLTDIDYTK